MIKMMLGFSAPRVADASSKRAAIATALGQFAGFRMARSPSTPTIFTVPEYGRPSKAMQVFRRLRIVKVWSGESVPFPINAVVPRIPIESAIRAGLGASIENSRIRFVFSSSRLA